AATQVVRTVNVIPDTTAPVITLNGNATIDLNVGGTYTEQGATATDDLDGDITASIVIGGVVDTNIGGTYLITYDVSDAAGNAATQVVRTVNVIPDTTAPVITLNGNATIDLNVGGTYTEQGATATDDLDGDITAGIVIGGVVDTNIGGTYLITYDVSDAAGNAATQVVRTVNVNNLPTDVIIHEGYFESGWDGWIEGGSDCARRLDEARSFEGSYSIRIRDNSGVASSMTSPTLDLSSFNEVEFDFYFFSRGMEVGEDFWLQYNDGSGFVTIETWARGTDFVNNAFDNFTVTLNASQYNLSSNAQFRLRCDASVNNDQIFIDQVVITGSGGTGTLLLKDDAPKDDNSPSEVLDITDNTFVKNELTLFPNPVGDILNIKTAKGGKMTYRIINSLGQIVNTGETSKEIIVDRLEAGMYYIEVTNEEDKMMKRFIKE
uniref:immunoglobulin-like domain-containing protein n=1 Tax=uncultured Algibacter sp. TaxID=298659 RepID=UPI002625E3CA